LSLSIKEKLAVLSLRMPLTKVLF